MSSNFSKTKSEIFDVAIVGGGAVGVFSALELTSGENAISGDKIVILEKNDRVGKKLLSTGNGQGNLTNKNITKENYHGINKNDAFINEFIINEKAVNLKAYLEDLGVFTVEGEDGKIYPLSKQASAVLDIIRFKLLSRHVDIKTGFSVLSVAKKDNVFYLDSENESVLARHVIFAFGGKAGKQFGTDGCSFRLAEFFGHKLTPLYPSLVQLKTETRPIRGLKGIKVEVKATLILDEKEIRSCVGGVLFTDFGVSGSAIFSLPSGIDLRKSNKIRIDFLPQKSPSETEEILKKRSTESSLFGDDLLCGIVNKKIGRVVLNSAKSNSVPDILFALKNFTLSVTGTLGFDYAQTTKGGIETKDIDEKTYESKLVKDLYLAGELIDVDGDCGGYNLTFAFVSGIVAAKNMKTKISPNGNIRR